MADVALVCPKCQNPWFVPTEFAFGPAQGGEVEPADLVEPDQQSMDDDIELDFNSAMELVPDEVRQVAIRNVKPSLDGGDRS